METGGTFNPTIPFPFGIEFQTKLVKVLTLDESVTDVALKYLRVEFFESPPLRWMVDRIIAYRDRYGKSPTITALLDMTRTLDPSIRGMYAQAVQQINVTPVKEEDYIKDSVLDWAKRNLFAEAHRKTKDLFNSGDVDGAYEQMRKSVDLIEATTWQRPDRGWFFEEFSKREARRVDSISLGSRITCGINEIDKLLGGGAEKGFMGMWIAYYKGGKSGILQNHGAAGVRSFKKVLHFSLEGKRDMIEDRYDACFSNEFYSEIKQGNMSQAKYKQVFDEYQHFKNLLVVRSLADNWSNTILDIDTEIQDLRKHHGWCPDMIVIDYGDLLHGRNGPYGSGWESDRDAYRDIKTLANKGFVVWTASQVQRPKYQDYQTREHVLTSKDIAGGVDKIRVVDFCGSLNATTEERYRNEMRMYPELAREAPSGGESITVNVDFARMRVGSTKEPPLGYNR